MYTNEAGVRPLLWKSQVPSASGVAKQFGHHKETSCIRKAIDIISFLLDEFTPTMVRFDFPERSNNFRTEVSRYVLQLAIAINENRPTARNEQYEQEWEHSISKPVRCRLMRTDPDHRDFNLSTCLGHVVDEFEVKSKQFLRNKQIT